MSYAKWFAVLHLSAILDSKINTLRKKGYLFNIIAIALLWVA